MNYQKINNISGWLVFAIATAVYALTIEPTVSFWDCGEFISAAYKLQVVHPPGAPMFLLMANIFTQFASGADRVAAMVNLFSGVASSFAILFLFWSITALAKKIALKDGPLDTGKIIAIMGSGAVGALACTFSDSFWFSAVEGEVYALSAFFTAIVFWAILKWENVADQPDSNRWLILIAYLMGLSLGVHLLNLLAIPAMVYIYYFKKFKVTRNGILAAAGVSVLILGIVQFIIIPKIPEYAAIADRIFVNGFGLPFGSGILFFAILIVTGLVFGIRKARQKGWVTLDTALHSLVFVLIGYSSYAMIVIRSNADTPIDMNNPENVVNLVSYINREQYGDRPLAFGPLFTAEMVGQEEGKMRYRKGEENYVEVGKDPIPVFDPKQSVLFPRAYKRAGTQPRHINFYQQWLNLRPGQKPSYGDNLNFLFTYQLGHMYYRYFMWNFVGRQNDTQGQGLDYENGNWISGIKAIDEWRLGSQDLPPSKANKANNTYYFLPLLLGLIGLFYQYKKSNTDFWVVAIFFVFTGIAINVYLNPEPLQPRERDYAYAGSYYVFTMWIGLGVMMIWDFLRKKLSSAPAAAVATLVGFGIPTIMGAQNWDDHDRSDKFTALHFAENYLNSCAPNAILFTMGDNDTYPLWYAQEVEGIRRDIRVINLSLLGTDWYINQARKQYYPEGTPAKMILKPEQVVQGVRDYVPFFDKKLAGYADLDKVITFIGDDRQSAKLPVQSGEYINYFPTKNLKIPVDKNLVLANGTVHPSDSNYVLPSLQWELPKNGLYKNDLAILDIIGSNKWERPIYFTISMGSDSYLGLDKFFQLEGLCYRLVPIEAPDRNGRVQPEVMHNNIMNKFKWGGLNEGIYVDPESFRMTINLKSNFVRLAESHLTKNDKESAIAVLDRCAEVMPNDKIPYNELNFRMVELYYIAGATEKAGNTSKLLFDRFHQDFEYYMSLKGKFLRAYESEATRAFTIMDELEKMSRRNGDTKTADEQAAILQNIRAKNG